MIRVLVAGLGNMGRSHALAYHRNPAFELVGLVNRSAPTLDPALAGYAGSVEIYAAKQDDVIPNHHARSLHDKVPGSLFTEIDGGHNTWQWAGVLRVRVEPVAANGEF